MEKNIEITKQYAEIMKHYKKKYRKYRNHERDVAPRSDTLLSPLSHPNTALYVFLMKFSLHLSRINKKK